MSEPQEDYITDALEMMGIAEPRQIVTEVSGFIPVFEVVLHHYKDYMTALVFGRMWQYCGMADGVCKASLDRIGKDLEISAVTVMRHAEKLVTDGYLIDTTPDRRNAPHEYVDGRKVEMKSRITAGISESKATVIKSKATVIKSKATVIKSQLIKQDNTNIKKDISLSSQDLQEVNAKVDYILSNNDNSKSWQGREMIRADLLGYADWYNLTTGQGMPKRAQKSWWKALGDWKAEGLTIADLQEAYTARSKWRTVSDPNELTKDAAAIHALPEAKREEKESDYTRLL